MMRNRLFLLIFVACLSRPCLPQAMSLAENPARAAAQAQLPNAPQPQRASSHFGPFANQGVERPVPASSQSDVVSLEGIRATLTLVSEVSSKRPTGSAFQARLEEPVALGGQSLLPKGTMFEGHVQTVRARHLMRPGSVFIEFDRVVLPGGAVQAINLSLLSTSSNAVKSDAEGRLRPALSKKRLATQLGGTALTAKLVDDISELVGGTAIGAAKARYFGLAAATTFFLIQKGRDVNLRPGDKVEVEFGRNGAALPSTVTCGPSVP